MLQGRISINSVLLLLLVNFVSGFRLMYISLIVSMRSSLTHLHFSAACAAAIDHRNHFFVVTNKINLVNLKQSSGRLVIVAKGFLKLPNLHMLIKQKSPSLPRDLALGTFGKLLILFSTKVNLLYLLYSTALRYCLLHLIKQICLLKAFLKTLILMTQVSLYLFFLLELILNCIIFL